MSNKVYLPSNGPEAWKDYLASDEHWATGKSAKSLAYCWEEANGFPKEFDEVLLAAGLQFEILLAVPEYKVYLDTKRAPSQNDIFILVRDSEGLVVIMIEGKVSESFTDLIEKWNGSRGKVHRFDFLANKLEINSNIKQYHGLYYQLFHRTVSPILMAEQFHAKKAIMIVHSFSQTNQRFQDYVGFINRLNPDIVPEVNVINKCKTLSSGIELYTGWIKGDAKYLTR